MLSELELLEIELTLAQTTPGDWVWSGHRRRNERELELVSEQDADQVVLAAGESQGSPVLLAAGRAAAIRVKGPGLQPAVDFCEFQPGTFEAELDLQLVQQADLKLLGNSKRWISLLLAECRRLNVKRAKARRKQKN